MKSLAVVACLVAAVSAVNLYNLHNAEWNSFKTTHGKSYGSEVEEQHRLQVFLQNRARILEHNRQYERGLVSYRLAVNQFTDLTHHEFNTLMNTLNITGRGQHNKKSIFSPLSVRAPAEMDWRAQGAVTAVKDQRRCGSCWAFSSTGALEGQLFLKSKQLVSLSEQNLIDCCTDNNGCEGGTMDNAYNYIKKNGGIDTESTYPYEGTDDGECRYDGKDSGATVSNIVDIPEGDEGNLMQAVATVGPVSVAIDASQDSFKFYSEGIYYEESCSSSELDHAVLVVGYGTDAKGGDYWLVKNSWGTTWGEQGYIKMARNKDNHCGIASMASYPVV